MFKLLIAASLAISASAHATFQELWVNDVDQGGFCVRLPASNSPVTDITSTACLFASKAIRRPDDINFAVGFHLQCQPFRCQWQMHRQSYVNSTIYN